MISVTLPLRLPNPLNGSHGHWACRAKNRKQVRDAVFLALRQRLKGFPLPAVVTITRIANSGGLDPHDGLPASCKPVVDAIADALEVDDRDPFVRWVFEQRRGKVYGVEIQIVTMASRCPDVAPGSARRPAPDHPDAESVKQASTAVKRRKVG